MGRAYYDKTSLIMWIMFGYYFTWIAGYEDGLDRLNIPGVVNLSIIIMSSIKGVKEEIYSFPNTLFDVPYVLKIS